MMKMMFILFVLVCSVACMVLNANQSPGMAEKAPSEIKGTERQPENCLSEDSQSCFGRVSGGYAPCSSSVCKEGYYYVCDWGVKRTMPCPLGYYINRKGERILARLVFDSVSKVCQWESPDCPRDLEPN